MTYAAALEFILVLSPFVAAALLIWLVINPARRRFWRRIREAYRDAPPPGRWGPHVHDNVLFVTTCVLLVLALAAIGAAYRAFEPSGGYGPFGKYAWVAAGAGLLVALWQFGAPWIFFRYLGARCPHCGASMVWQMETAAAPYTDTAYPRYRCLRCPTEISTKD